MEKLRKIKNKILLTLGIFFAAILLGFMLICASYTLPSERVSMHVRESGDLLVNEGDYWWMIPNEPKTVLDNFTDCIMLLTSAYDGEEGIVDKAINNYRCYLKKGSKQESCQVCGTLAENQEKKLSYARYWHGYIVVLKPLLLFLNLREIRQLNLFIVLAYISIICLLLYRRKKAGYIIPYLLACSYLSPMTIAMSLQNSTVFHTMSISVIVFLLLYTKKWFYEHIWIFFMLVGMMTSFVDFLTYPVVTLAFPLIFYFIMEQDKKPLKNLSGLILYSGMWAFGYVGMWASKWGISSLISGKNYFSKALDSIFIRSGNVVADQMITYSDVCRQLYTFLSSDLIWRMLPVFLVLCVIIFVFSEKLWRRWSICVIFLLISLYPFIWAFGAKNHTWVHTIFTHRILAVLIFSLSCCVLPLIGKFKRSKK